MRQHTFFITGTDTGIGKTHISVGLLQLFNRHHYSTIGVKPVATGGVEDNNTQRFYHDDARALQHAASIFLEDFYVNPFLFTPPIAPHLAAAETNKLLTVDLIMSVLQQTIYSSADICIIEGVGGWQVPLNHHETMADVVMRLNARVILVVGMRLGCLNHAILTARAIQASGLCFAGWVANCIDPVMQKREENIHTLIKWIPAPLLGVVAYQQAAAEVFYSSLTTLVSPDENP